MSALLPIHSLGSELFSAILLGLFSSQLQNFPIWTSLIDYNPICCEHTGNCLLMPNSILFGLHCQPKRGGKQEHESVNRRRMNQQVCWRAGDRNMKTKQHRSHWQNQATQPSLTPHLKASKHDGKIPVSTVCACVCLLWPDSVFTTNALTAHMAHW